MSKKNVKKSITVGDYRVERINADGIVIKDRFTRRPVIKFPSLKKLD